MNAHKDTQHPAGQTVSEDKGQRTLSDYIRSIKRAEAFDAVAREKKLTFDEWWNSYGIDPFVTELRECFTINPDPYVRQIWNAALTHGTLS